MKKKAFKIAGIAILTFALIANLQYALFNYGLKDNGRGAQLYAQGGTAVASCLQVLVLQPHMGEQQGAGCYKDVPGDDLLEGYVVTCYADANRNCQPRSCRQAINCYTKAPE